MTEETFIDAKTACALLGVRPQTLYAYASRDLLRVVRDPKDSRRRLYHAQDVADLSAKHRRPRARAEVAAQAIRWGDPVLTTAISHVRDGELWFGETRALTLAACATLEDTLAHHCRAALEPQGTRTTQATGGTGMVMGIAGALGFLAAQAAQAREVAGRSRAALAQEGAALLSDLVDAMLGPHARAPLPIHLRMAHAWRLNAQETDSLRAALVLLSDHELAPSTFAVRICASAGASLPAAILAGLATLSGPRHGGVDQRARTALAEIAKSPAAFDRFAAGQDHNSFDPYTFGYGHPLYPAGDPRAVYLLDTLDPDATAPRAVRQAAARLGIPPNIDAALAALTDGAHWPEHAGLQIFAIARTAGWIAHAIEQNESPVLIRPRAQYVRA